MLPPDPCASHWLRGALNLPDGADPFPWQERLLGLFLRGQIPRALDLPTGLGKTSVIAIWLVARALGAPVPRRLVYVVDRRAVVDQATAVADGLVAWVQSNPAVGEALGLRDEGLAVSTLRGQHADNRRWLDDPAAPAVVVGTVDMVGSRLLFSGYGTSRKMRPYHAALLGNDSLFVLDEAHLVPPFAALLQQVVAGQEGPLGPSAPPVAPPLRLICLSATMERPTWELTGEGQDGTFTLDEADRAHPVVNQRIHARKRLSTLPPDGRLDEQLARLARQRAAAACRIVVFCDARAVAQKVADLLSAKGDLDVNLFVGARRGWERDRAADWLAQHGFLAGAPAPLSRPAVLVATSAAEVGVDLDADHAVMDVVPWERIVQRLGRVNRRGLGNAEIQVVRAPNSLIEAARKKDYDKRSPLERAALDRFNTTLTLLDNADDASPAALSAMSGVGRADIEVASTPAPLSPPLERPPLEAWAMTSLELHPGRPAVAPYLRGWIEEAEPELSLVWRALLPPDGRPKAELARYVEATPAHLTERLSTESRRALDWLWGRVEALQKADQLAWSSDRRLALVVDRAAAFTRPLRIQDLTDWVRASPGERQRREVELDGHTLLLDADLGGLTEGLLDAAASATPPTADGGPPWPGLPFRVRRGPADAPPAAERGGWRERLRLPQAVDADGEVLEWLLIDRFKSDAATEEDRSAGAPQGLMAHQHQTAQRAADLAARLGLDPALTRVLTTAARLHDEGKRAPRWQRAMQGASPGEEPLAKTLGPCRPALLGGYRHEFGSLPYAAADPGLQALNPDEQALALHLIAAHHGGARPHLSTEGCDDAPPSALQARAAAVARRFLDLTALYGPWGLAWLETLLRAADQQASRDNERAPSAVEPRP